MNYSMSIRLSTALLMSSLRIVFFHIVVDSDDTATKILAVLNKEKVGRVTFMPLNRIRPRPASTAQLDQGVCANAR